VRSVSYARRIPRGRAYFDRSVAEGKTKIEALRALQRHVSDAAVANRMVTGSEHPR